MWIIPKNLHTCHFVPDTEALTLDLSELSTMCEQSLMWRSKPSNVRTWCQRWKRVGWMQHLFGRMLRPSRGQAFVEKWTSSVVASLVNPSQAQEEEQETKTLATYGHTSSEESKLSDLPLFSWKTLKALSVQSSKATNGMTQRERQFCFMSLENWKEWIIRQRREYSQRLKLERHTKEKECLSWGFKLIIMNPVLNGSKSHTFFIQKEEVKSSMDLNLQGLRWYTPTAGSKDHTTGIQSYLRRLKLGKQIDLNGQVVLEKFQKTKTLKAGKLNPRWVDLLMGLPIGWSCPAFTKLVRVEQMNLEVLGMELSQVQRQELLSHCSKPWPTPNSRDHKDCIGSVPPSVTVTRGYSLGQAIAYEYIQHINSLQHNTQDHD